MNATTIVIRLDDESLELPAGTTLAQLLVLRELGPGDVATALNGEFVPRAARAAQALASGDQVLVFQAIVGG